MHPAGDRKLNILFLGSYYPPYAIGGAEKMFHTHVQTFATHGHNISVVTLGPNKEIEEEEAPDHNIHIYRCPIRNLYWPLGEKPSIIERVLWHILDCYNPFHHKDLAEIVRSVRPDIVICEILTGWSAYVWKFFRKRNIPIIQISHDSSFLCAWGTMFRNGSTCKKQCSKCRLFTYPYRRYNKYVDHFVFVSKTQQKRFEGLKFTKQACSVIYNAEDITLEKKQKIWDGCGTFRLGLLATLSEGKGVLQLVRAFKLLKGNFELIIGGKAVSPEFHNRIIDEINNDNRIALVGYTTPDTFFKSIDLAVVPSVVHESFGLVAIEACSKEVPVIASQAGGLTEIVKENVNGMFCNSNDIHSIASTIQKVYDNKPLYRQLVSHTHESIKDFIDTEKLYRDLERICLSLIKE